ncbi:DUF2892 domain-containing protein [Geomonas sp. Red32]|uniref:SRPBCC family protein n=1 Tax=Geomonas sp. Red32 TaxID=2912856 RepID=UPI00202CDB30|nr:SRPBCC family protein [Geomonas sp. Red32]MCM0080746.1 DUF2892 domain-containing protein [Geomonas sp. Red32]
METTHTAREERSRPGREQRQTEVNVNDKERTASVMGGAALALSGLRSLTKKQYLPGLAMMAAGGMLLYRGATGHCDLYQALGVDTAHSEGGIRLEKVLTINRPRQEVYEFWRNFENLPRFMRHLDAVRITGDRTSHWKARGPGGVTVEWDAEMTADYPGQQISWHSTGDAGLPNRGLVEFSDAPGDRGTEVKIAIDLYPPGGVAGRTAARLARAVTAQQVEEDLKRLKQLLETGEVATAERTLH